MRGATARELHGAALLTRDVEVEGTSFFPLFTPDGEVLRVMIVRADSPEIWLVDREPGRFRTTGDRSVRLELSLYDLVDAGHRAEARLRGLWHWDPWWVIAAARYLGHPLAGSLKATNAAGRLGRGVRGLVYSTDLARIRWVQGPFGLPIGRWKAGRLPAREEALPPPARRVGWRLEPLWERPGWPGYSPVRRGQGSRKPSRPRT